MLIPDNVYPVIHHDISSYPVQALGRIGPFGVSLGESVVRSGGFRKKSPFSGRRTGPGSVIRRPGRGDCDPGEELMATAV